MKAFGRGIILAAQNTPPGSPAEDDAYLVTAPASGDWAGHENDIAHYHGSAWAFITAWSGLEVYDLGAGAVRRYNGSSWGYADAVTDKIVGVRWDTSNSSPQLEQVNVYGEVIDQWSHERFDAHPIWGGMRRCTVTADGTVTYGSNARGDGLTLDGSAGQVMVEVPSCYLRAKKDGKYQYWWVSPYAYPGFNFSPAHLQGGGSQKAAIYVGAYAGCLGVDDSGNEHLISKTGEQPWTGGCIGKIPFGTGTSEISVGDVVTGETSGKSGTVVAVRVLSESWVGGDAAGYIWVKFPGVEWSAWTNPENIQVSEATVAATTEAGSALSLTRQGAEDYAGSYGSRWHICNIWTWDLLFWLYVIEFCNFNSQSTSVGLGAGITSKASGTGFAGEENGADSADTNIGTNGTGTGTGSDGYTPIVWRGIENPWGNIYQFVIGWDAVDAEYRVLKRNGTGTSACPIGAGDYESSAAVPIVDDGYASGILFEDLTKFLIIASAVAGSSSTYVADYWYAHNAGQSNILLAGGGWSGGANAGFGGRYANYVASFSSRSIGARPEFL